MENKFTELLNNIAAVGFIGILGITIASVISILVRLAILIWTVDACVMIP